MPSTAKTFIVAGVLSVVCSIFVSTAATVLKPIQEYNKDLDKKKNILSAAGLMKEGIDVEVAFKAVDVIVIELESGKIAAHIDAAKFDQRKAMRDPATSRALKVSEDIASIRRLEKYANVYPVKRDVHLKSSSL